MELRELEAKLRAGYMNRERSTQMAEKQAIIEAQKVTVLLGGCLFLCTASAV